MKKILLLAVVALSSNSYGFDSSIIEHREKSGQTRTAAEDKFLNLSPGLALSEFGVSHEVAVNKSFDLSEGRAGTIDIEIEFNSSTDTDNESEVIKQLSFGGGDSVFKVQYSNNSDNFLYGAGVDISGWEYTVELDSGNIVNDETVLGSYNLYAHYKVQDDWYLGIKAAYYDVLSDNDENAIEKEINGDSTVNIRGLLKFKAKDGAQLWLQADLIFPLAGEDPIFTLGAAMNFNVL